MAEKHRERTQFPAEHDLSLEVIRERVAHIANTLEKFELEEKKQAHEFLQRAKAFIRAELRAPSEIKDADADALQQLGELLSQIDDLIQNIASLI